MPSEKPTTPHKLATIRVLDSILYKLYWYPSLSFLVSIRYSMFPPPTPKLYHGFAEACFSTINYLMPQRFLFDVRRSVGEIPPSKEQWAREALLKCFTHCSAERIAMVQPMGPTPDPAPFRVMQPSMLHFNIRLFPTGPVAIDWVAEGWSEEIRQQLRIPELYVNTESSPRWAKDTLFDEVL